MVGVILAGGKGARLKPFTMTIPKPLLPLGEMPVIEVLIRQLAATGIDRIVLTVGHLAHLFMGTIGDGSRWGVEIEYSIEEEPLGTAGPLRFLKDPGDTFLVVNGDILTTLDFRELFLSHREHGAIATIAVNRREVPVDFGVVEITPDGGLANYKEKPRLTYDVSMGINVFSARARDVLPGAGKFDMPDLMLALRRKGEKVICYRTNCYWQDIGHFDDYQRASEDFSRDPSRFLSPVLQLK